MWLSKNPMLASYRSRLLGYRTHYQCTTCNSHCETASFFHFRMLLNKMTTAPMSCTLEEEGEAVAVAKEVYSTLVEAAKELHIVVAKVGLHIVVVKERNSSPRQQAPRNFEER